MGKPSIKWTEPEKLLARLSSGSVAGVLSRSKLGDLDREFVVVDREVKAAHGTIRLLGGVEFPSGAKAVEALGDKIDPAAAEAFSEAPGPVWFHSAKLVEAHEPRAIAKGGEPAPAEAAKARPLWGSPAGKGRIATRIAALLPDHETYVEPFAGSAAVLYAKDPARREVLSDADGTIVDAFRTLKGLTDEQLAKLAGLPWKGDRATFERLRAANPSDPVGKVHRFAYLTRFSHGYKRGNFTPSHDGVAYGVAHATASRDRLRNVTIESGDYERIVRKYDSPSTAFFLDPPYAGHNVNVGESKFDEERFAKTVSALKGKVLITYGTRGKLPGLLRDSGFHLARIATWRSYSNAPGASPSQQLEQVVATNYPIGNDAIKSFVSKLAEVDPEAIVVFDDEEFEIDLAKREAKLRPLWKSPGGKSAMAAQIAAMLPPHKTYVEPFVGSGAVLYAKEPSEREVVNDLDPTIAAGWAALAKLTEADAAALARKEWKGNEATFRKLKAAKGSSPVDALHKLIYLARFSFVGTRASFDKAQAGTVARAAERLAETSKRFRGLRVHAEDYGAVVRRYDAPDTVFFFDPPYPGSYGLDRTAAENRTETGERSFDEGKFVETLKGIKGKWIVTYGVGGEGPKLLKAAGYRCKRIATPARMKTRRAVAGAGEVLINLVFSNFTPTRKREIEASPISEEHLAPLTDGDLVELLKGISAEIEQGGGGDELLAVGSALVSECEKRGVVVEALSLASALCGLPEGSEYPLAGEQKQRVDTGDLETLPLGHSTTAPGSERTVEPAEAESSATTGENEPADLGRTEIQILKADDLRYVLGVALEPNDGRNGAPLEPDTQRDVYSAEDIRKAAWEFFRRYRAAGEMHERKLGDNEIEIVESYVAPVAFEIDGKPVREGAWLVGAHIVSDRLWNEIKAGKRNAWSVDGRAKRKPFEG